MQHIYVHALCHPISNEQVLFRQIHSASISELADMYEVLMSTSFREVDCWRHQLSRASFKHKTTSAKRTSKLNLRFRF